MQMGIWTVVIGSEWGTMVLKRVIRIKVYGWAEKDVRDQSLPGQMADYPTARPEINDCRHNNRADGASHTARRPMQFGTSRLRSKHQQMEFPE
jgi:hypothetical protein